jgi:predicted RNA methylase
MFNKDFYPTPSSVISKMAAKVKTWKKDTVLDPSAGKGNILDWVRVHKRNKNLIAFEIEEDLRSILMAKDDVKLIGRDFLEDHCPYSPNVILMNPPFSQGAKHFIRAHELLKEGSLVCLLNEQTIKNPSDFYKQRVVEIIKESGAEVEYLGDCFKTAERKTGVNVAMIVVHKTKEQKAFDFDVDLDQEYHAKKEFSQMSSELEISDYFTQKESAYLAAIEQAKQIVETVEKFKSVFESLRGGYFYSDKARDLLWEGRFNEFVSEFNASAWDKILSESKFATMVTGQVKEQFQQKFNKQKDAAFTKKNMTEMFAALLHNRSDILDNCLIEVFDDMTKYYDENREHIEGWKTNDHYKVNRKVILPWITYGSWVALYEVSYHYQERCRDIDRALCYLSGKKFEDVTAIIDGKKEVIEPGIITIVDAIGKQGKAIRDGETSVKECESTFFKIKFYKKGTMHLKFKDELLWQWFNCRVAELKGYPLPENVSTAKKAAKKGYSRAKEVLLRLT